MVVETGTSAKELIRHRGRRRKQHRVGEVIKTKTSWFVRYYTGKMVSHTKRDGEVTTIREVVCHRLGSREDFPTENAAQGAADTYMKTIITPHGAVHSTVTIDRYYSDVILEWWKRNLKPSTLYGYEKNWRLYLKPVMADVRLAEYSIVDAGNFLDSLVVKGLNSTTIAHIRTTANLIFAHAVTKGVIAANPFTGAKMTEKAKAPAKTYKYTMQEVHDILRALDGNLKAQTAVGLCYFAGLRPGEARATRWENYDGASLKVEQSVFRTHVTAPKTRESVAVIPVVAPLRELLARLHNEEGNPAEGWILPGENGGPLSLDFLARTVIRPLLALQGIDWHGYYACRRGIATIATDVLRDPTGAAGMLRQKGIDTTAKFYIGIRSESTVRAMAEFERLYSVIGKQLPSPKITQSNTQSDVAESSQVVDNNHAEGCVSG